MTTAMPVVAQQGSARRINRYVLPAADVPAPPTVVAVRDLDLHYGAFQALTKVSVEIPDRTITALIGPSGCGKSTLLRCINRLNDLVPGVRVQGQVQVAGQDVLGAQLPVQELRRLVGMVFQRPNPFPLSVAENLTYGPRLHGTLSRSDATVLVEEVLQAVGLWEALKDRLHTSALRLSPEQQQRLCIARALATRPAVLLMDEPCSALDPVATEHIEALMLRLASERAIIVVTHNMQQAQRVSTYSGFMLMGELVEFGLTPQLFEAARDTRTADYVAGRFG
ncbi:phosphate ABC transporter ATP-binding protein [Gemmatimonas phototrophica]|uniref:phosphate ABC transporter ATP-binding protein n=1 Tax=Gemmatimonas phototrophica TaxID=1379270 RepID=UPI000ADB49FC